MPGRMSVAAFARDCSLQVDQVLPSRCACHLNDLSGLVETLQLTALMAAAGSQEHALC